MTSPCPSATLGKPAFISVLLIALLFLPVGAKGISPKEILVVYNTADPDSEKLAEAYRDARALPDSRLLGLDLPLKQDITRGEYEKALVAPMRKFMDENELWTRGPDTQGLTVPTVNMIRVVLLMRGVPLRITPSPAPANPESDGTTPPADPISPRDEASVDSELSMFGIEGLPAKGVLKNAFYDSKVSLAETNAPYLVLTSRIDAPTYAICKRMIDDAVATEKTGLWGRAYVDIANKFPEGDKWLEEIVAVNRKTGIPTVTDRFNDTFPKNYPMTDAALYYGWYDWNVSGPFLNTGFLFRPGAVAIHLHSFSGQQLTDAHQNWCAPLLVRGAAATVGNVYEPYLHLTHHFDILHDRLLKGWTLAEAAWAAMPVASWQGIVLGDPLYRPYRHINGTGNNRLQDRDYRALRAASRQWPDDDTLRRQKLSAAAEKLKSGSLAEGLAMDFRESKDLESAKLWIKKAREFFPDRPNKLRQDLQLVSILRESDQNREAIQELRAAKATYVALPEAESVSGWLDILDPPPPPVADPTKFGREWSRVKSMNYGFLLESVWHPPLAFEEVAVPRLPPELELQALWFAGSFGREFRLKDGRQLRIVQFGEWNLGGQDFAHAAIEIDGAPYTGDIEIDTRTPDWENHGHSTNPAFSDTILHVAFEPPLREMFVRTSNHRQVPELLISPSQLADALRLPSRDTAIAIPGRCLQPLRKMPALSIERLLREAALRRASRKASRLLQTKEAHDIDTALFHATAETLGYGGNQLPMRLLAQRAPLRSLRADHNTAEAILLGTAGFLDPDLHHKAPEETREYLRDLWETWWKVRPDHEPPESRRPAWKTHGQRPANHPHRRAGGLSVLVRNWPEFRKLALAAPFSVKPLTDFLHSLKHEFWSHHHTLTSVRSATAVSVFGKNLALELSANHLIPLALHENRFTYRDYHKHRHSAINRKLRRCGIRLFGTEAAAKPWLRRLCHQQALLEIYHDFCLEDFSDCEQCPFPEQLAQWR